MFKPRFARRSLRRYTTKGLDDVERWMVDSARADGIEGASVLEIGGGIGQLQAELLATGADTGRVVEVVAAYEPFAEELARSKGLGDRSAFVVADVLEDADAVAPADVVLMNRVVCCSPDGIELTSAAARLARRALVLSYPRRLLAVRAVAGLQNAFFRLLGRTFRVFVHSPEALVAAAESAGLRRESGGHTLVWEYVVLRRAG
jgi:magnesium-protoporphyrin O-methyltransferase